MSSLKKYFCCCCPEAPPEPQPVQKPNRQDRYLDSDNPIQAIMESPQIQSLTVASINIFLEDPQQSQQYSTVSHEQAAKFKKAVLDSRVQNPKICNQLMKDLLNLLPKKGSKVRTNSKVKKGSSLKKNRRSDNKLKTLGTNFKDQTKKSRKIVPESQELPTIISKRPSKLANEVSLSNLLVQQKDGGNSSQILAEQNKKRPKQTRDSKKTDLSKSPYLLARTQSLKKRQEEIDLKKVVQKNDSDEQEEEQQQFKTGFHTLMEQNSNDYLKIVKTFVYLYTSPYIYKDLNKRLTESRYDNYTKIVGFVVDALNKLPMDKKYEFKLNFTMPFSLYRGIKSKNSFPEDRGYWKAFTSCSLKRTIAQQFAESSNGTLIQILLKPPINHMYIKVPKDPKFTFYQEEEVILFPFFHYEVLQKKGNKVKVREVKRSEVTFGHSMPT